MSREVETDEPVYTIYVNPTEYRKTKPEVRRDPELRGKVRVRKSLLVKPGEAVGVDEVAIRMRRFEDEFSTTLELPNTDPVREGK